LDKTASKQRTWGIFIFTISDVYDLSYKQFPRTLPKFLSARLIASVTASFFDYRVTSSYQDY
jgi:hypothetical protein